MKHAYLIMAHDNYEQLQLLVQLLDTPENDIYIHIDKKSEMPGFQIKAKYSKVIVFQEISIYWGTYGIAACEIKLLEKAYSSGNYDYYHLLSGQDLPIRTIKEIGSFLRSIRDMNLCPSIMRRWKEILKSPEGHGSIICLFDRGIRLSQIC